MARPAESEVPDGRPTVTVIGSAVVRAEPDEAILLISLSALQDAPGRALADVSARSNALLALLDELSVGRGDRSTAGISVREEFDHTADGRRSLGHRATALVSVRLTDADLIGRLITDSTENLAARIEGPRWLISPSNPARLEAARRAAADCRRKAQAYAEGAGVRLGPLLRLTEADEQITIRAAGGLKPMGAEPIAAEPGEREVSAAVRATFMLEAG